MSFRKFHKLIADSFGEVERIQKEEWKPLPIAQIIERIKTDDMPTLEELVSLGIYSNQIRQYYHNGQARAGSEKYDTEYCVFVNTEDFSSGFVPLEHTQESIYALAQLWSVYMDDFEALEEHEPAENWRSVK